MFICVSEFFFFPFYTFTLSLGTNRAKHQCLIQTRIEGQEIKQGYICSQESLTPVCRALSVWRKSSECRAMHVSSTGTTAVKLLFFLL